MSFHVSPSSAARAAGSHPADLVPTVVVAEAVRAALTSDWQEGPATLSVRLAHMGLVVAISAVDAATPASAGGTELEQTPDTIHFQVEGDAGFAALPALLGRDEAAAAARRAATTSDPVVQRLSRALEEAERSSGAFAGLFADAVRLAIVTRILGVHQRPMPLVEPEPETVPETEPAPGRRRPRTGLVAWRLKRVVAFVDDHLAEPVTLADMAAAVGLSRMHFAAQFRVATGLRPHEYLLRRRIARAQEMLRETREPLVQIALGVGFQTQAHFTTVFRRLVGDTPYQWRCAHAVSR